MYIVGRRDYNYSEEEIEVKITQRIEPSILKVVNYDLKPLEERVINSGKEGIEVEVYRVSKEKDKKSSELLYVNSYETVGAIVQIGSGK